MADPARAGAPEDEKDFGVLLDALRARGAERFDPVCFRFIEGLAQRAAASRDGVRSLLDRRLANALAAFRDRLTRAEREATETLAAARARFPEVADELARHRDAGEFGALHRRLAMLEAKARPGPLADLLAAMGERSSAACEADPRELKALAYFRSTWSRLNVNRQLADAFAQAPENAGPLNSHFLVLQSLDAMRRLSPEYLAQFVSYVDALLWLDQAAGGRVSAQKSATRGERAADTQRKARASRREKRKPRGDDAG